MDEIRILVIVVFIAIALLLIYRWTVKRKQAVNNVLGRTDEEKISIINNALEIYGFFYDNDNDIISSQMYPWQRNMGYCLLYDELAPSLNMVIDSEPIYFEYDERRWLIEFWKGQYGMTTGGEVGIYVTDKDDIDVPGVFSGTFFESVTDEERLNIRFNLKKNEESLFTRKEHHWWLTGFDVGIFSKPKSLSMDIRLIFPHYTMKEAFLIGLRNAGYTESDYKEFNNMIYITFDTPKSNQPSHNYKLLLPFIQLSNKTYCSLYNWLTRDFERTIDKIYFLCIYYPNLFKIVAGNHRAEKIQKAYELIHSYLNGDEVKENEHI